MELFSEIKKIIVKLFAVEEEEVTEDEMQILEDMILELGD